MSNSPLVNVTIISPNRNSPRNNKIQKITIHHFASIASIEAVGNWLARADTRASYNYGVGTDGRVALYVNERDRSWASSNAVNDHQAVTIGVQNNATGGDWSVSQTAFNKLIELVVDICKRNNIKQLNWTGNADGNLTTHNMFSNTNCCGPFLMNRMPEIARLVNLQLSNNVVTNREVCEHCGALLSQQVPLVSEPAVPVVAVPFMVRITNPVIIYRGIGQDNAIHGTISSGSFTIVEVVNNWGRLKSGVGWINLTGLVRV